MSIYRNTNVPTVEQAAIDRLREIDEELKQLEQEARELRARIEAYKGLSVLNDERMNQRLRSLLVGN